MMLWIVFSLAVFAGLAAIIFNDSSRSAVS